MNNLKIAIIGLGNHAQENLLPAINNVAGIDIYAVQSRNRLRARTVAARYNVPNTVVSEDPLPMLLDDNCDGIIVSATPKVHQDILCKAVKARKPVFVEKPPAVDLAGLKKIHGALSQYDESFVMQFGFNFRFSDFYRQIEEMTIKSTTIRYMKIKSYSAKPDVAMWDCDDVLDSSLYAVHIHAIEMLCYTLGGLESLTHKLVWLDDRKYVLTITASFKNGAVGALELSNASNRFEFDVECVDAKKNVFRSEGFNHMSVFGPDYESAETFKPKSFISYEVPFLRGGFDRTGYARQFEFFRDSIVTGREDQRSITSCIDAYKIIERVTHD